MVILDVVSLGTCVCQTEDGRLLEGTCLCVCPCASACVGVCMVCVCVCLYMVR